MRSGGGGTSEVRGAEEESKITSVGPGGSWQTGNLQEGARQPSFKSPIQCWQSGLQGLQFSGGLWR